jgi:hypothetical protein
VCWCGPSLSKHGLKAGIAAEAEVYLLGNGTKTPVSAATYIIKGIPVTTNRITEDTTGPVAVIKGSSFVSWRDSDQSGSREGFQEDVVQKEFNECAVIIDCNCREV